MNTESSDPQNQKLILHYISPSQQLCDSSEIILVNPSNLQFINLPSFEIDFAVAETAKRAVANRKKGRFILMPVKKRIFHSI